jgi:hypothetical protein
MSRRLCDELLAEDCRSDFGVDTVRSDDQVALDSLAILEGNDTFLTVDRHNAGGSANDRGFAWSIFGRRESLELVVEIYSVVEQPGRSEVLTGINWSLDLSCEVCVGAFVVLWEDQSVCGGKRCPTWGKRSGTERTQSARDL